MEPVNYEPLLRAEPPEDLVGWALRKGALSKEYLIYKAGWEYEPLEDCCQRAAEVVCSACGTRFTAKKLEVGACSNGYAAAPFGFLHPETMEGVV